MWKKGEITVFVSLLMAVLLFFLQACLQSAQSAFLRSQTQEALELAEYSVLSEFHQGLLERYGLFYVDLGYGKAQEDTEYLKQQIRRFLNGNLPKGCVNALEVWDFSRASDQKGAAFYEQAVAYEKHRTGAALLERLQSCGQLGYEAEACSQDYEEMKRQEQENLQEQQRRSQEAGEEPGSDLTSSGETLDGGILTLVLEHPEKVSGKKAVLSEAPSMRTCLQGAGPRGIHRRNPGNDLFFHAYLLENFSHAVDFMTEDQTPEPWLDYQLEYLIAGEDSDIANLEKVCRRILAFREGMNYAYIQTDSGKKAECEALAVLMVGITLIPELVEAVKQMLLLAWAHAESVMDVRMLLNGKKSAFYKSGGVWRTSLEGALNLRNSISGFSQQEDAGGISYEDYLGILLSTAGREKKTMRGLDVIEGVIRGSLGNSSFYVDQCVDSFRVRMLIDNGKELTAERNFAYEW